MAMKSFTMLVLMLLVAVVMFQIGYAASYNSDKFGSSSSSAAAPSSINENHDDEALAPGISPEKEAYLNYCMDAAAETWDVDDLYDQFLFFLVGRRKEFINAKYCKSFLSLGKACYDAVVFVWKVSLDGPFVPGLPNPVPERASRTWNYCTNVVAASPAPAPHQFIIKE